MRFFSTIVLFAWFATLSGQQDFTRFYGESFRADDEAGYLIEMIAGNPTVIGVRQDPTTGLGRLGGFGFNARTGEVTASYLMGPPSTYILQQSWPTPDGGFLLNYVDLADFSYAITYVNNDFTERWTQTAPGNYELPINYTFDKDGTVILLYAGPGEVGIDTRAARYNADDGSFVGFMELMRFPNEVPLHLTPLGPGEGYLLGGTDLGNGSNGRAYLRRVNDDFASTWVRYPSEVGSGTMLSVSGATLTEGGEIWATGYVGIAFDNLRGFLRFTPNGELIQAEALEGDASLQEKVTWTEKGFLAQGNTNGFGAFYCAVDVKPGNETVVRATYRQGDPGNEDPPYNSALYLPDSALLFAVIDDDFSTQGDRQMLVDKTDLVDDDLTRLDFGTEGGNQNEYARQIVRHPNGREWVILANAGRPDGVASGAQLSVINPNDGSVREVIYPSDRINNVGRQFISALPDGRLLVGESENDRVTFTVLDEDLNVAEQFEQPNNLQYASGFTGLVLRDGRIVVTQDQYNREANSSDQQLVFHAADGSLLDSVFAFGSVAEMVQLNGDQLITVGFDPLNDDDPFSGSLRSINLRDGTQDWRVTLRMDGCSRPRVTDVQRVLGDRIAVALFSRNCGTPSGASVQYQLYNAEGELEKSTELPMTGALYGVPKLSQRAEGGEISLAFPEILENNNPRVRLFRLNSASGEVVADTSFTDFRGDYLSVEDLWYTEGNRLAILGTAQAMTLPSSFDIFLIASSSESLVQTVSHGLDVSVSVSPNPTTNRLTVQLNATGTHDLRVLSTTGQLVARAQVQGTLGGTDHVFELSSLPAGVYNLLISNERVRTRTLRFVKL